MEISVADAGQQLDELVRRVAQGDEVVLTADGEPVARLERVTVKRVFGPEEVARRGRVLDEFQRSASSKILPGPDAAHAADFLYDDETGLPK